MNLFFTYQTELPNGVGYELFHFQHFMILALCFVIVAAGWFLYRSMRQSGRKRRFRLVLADTLLLLILMRLLYVYLCGAELLYDLPLHLCSIAGMLCFLYEHFGMKMHGFVRSMTEQTLFSLCLPGAVLALLFSDGAMYPVFHFITIQSSLFHTLIILYVVILLSDGVIVPSVREAYRALLFLAVLVPVMMAFDVHFHTNYMFLLFPSEGSPLTYPYARYGYAGYLISYALTSAAEIFLINLIMEKCKSTEEQIRTMKSERRESVSETFKKIFSIKEDSASNEEIRSRLLDGGEVTGTNMCVLICAMVIASVGLNTGSTAVIIGAMLISPLMGSILASGYAVVSADYPLLRKYLIGFAMQIIISVLASMIYFFLSPVKEPSAELLARTSPSFFDVLIAFFGGLAGIIGQTREDKVTNIIPGVAIATALMPPLCTCGYSIANANWRMLAGASYLFLINAYFIGLSACMILSILQIPKKREFTEKEWKMRRFRMIRNTIFIMLPSIYLLYIMVH